MKSWRKKDGRGEMGTKLRFAILKAWTTRLGNHHEDVMFEVDEERIRKQFKKHMERNLRMFRERKYIQARYTLEEVQALIDLTWDDVIEDFKDISVRIM